MALRDATISKERGNTLVHGNVRVKKVRAVRLSDLREAAAEQFPETSEDDIFVSGYSQDGGILLLLLAEK